jgi:hypothetical protein
MHLAGVAESSDAVAKRPLRTLGRKLQSSAREVDRKVDLVSLRIQRLPDLGIERVVHHVLITP